MMHLHLVHPDYRSMYISPFILVRDDRWGFFNPHYNRAHSGSCAEVGTPFCALTGNAEVGEHILTFNSDTLPIDVLKETYPEHFIQGHA